MRATDRPNAIETRLFSLYEQCKAFLQDPEARILCWRIRADEAAMMRTFFAIESDELGELPAIFLQCDAPFETSERYTTALIQALEESCRESHEDFQSEGLALWSASKPPAQMSAAHRFVFQLKDFVRHHQALFPMAVAVLEPPSITDPSAFQAWITSVVTVCPAEVRLIVPELIEAPLVSPLKPHLQTLMQVIDADLKMPEAVASLSRTLPDKASPSGLFRQHFVALTQAAGAGQLEQVKTEASAAVTIAQQEAWWHLEVTALCAQGAAFQSAASSSQGSQQTGHYAEALKSYEQALVACTRLEGVDPTLGAQLRLKVMLSLAGVRVAQGQYRPAALVYEDCAALAIQTHESILQLEGWRMASWCYEQSREHRSAWRCAQSGLELGRTLDEKTRQQTTLAYLGQGMMRLCSRGEYVGYHRSIDHTFAQLLGTPDWQPSSKPSTPQSAGGVS